MKYKLTEVKPQIFLLTFKGQYDLNMTFLRYQEFYESPNPKFRGKNFTIFDFMEWYAKQHDGVFTYTKDWVGFNCPGHIFDEIKVKDRNKYDDLMDEVVDHCMNESFKKYNDSKFYLIGAKEGEIGTIKHEIAHGYFYLNPSYQKEMKALVKGLNPEFKKHMFEILTKVRYAKKVLVDETQAWLAVEDEDFIKAYKIKLSEENLPFREVFNRYYEKKIIFVL